MDYFLSVAFITSLLQIIWIDLLLSGDNAIIIALACRSLPEGQRKWGIILGAGAAVVLRIIFALIISYLLEVSFLKLAGGFLLFWIALKLLTGADHGPTQVKDSTNLWSAVRTIALADAVMSLDNVVAIAAAAGEHRILFVFGLLLSLPLIVFGSTLILKIIQHFPIFVWAGAALLGWIAAEMIVGDKFVLTQLGEQWYEITKTHNNTNILNPIATLKYSAAVIGAIFVLTVGGWLKSRKTQKPHTSGP